MIQAKASMFGSSGSKSCEGKRKKKVNKKQTEKCFKCGEKRHWKPDCPKNGQGDR